MKNVRYVIEVGPDVTPLDAEALIAQWNATDQHTVVIGKGIRIHDLKTGNVVGSLGDYIRVDHALAEPRESLASLVAPLLVVAIPLAFVIALLVAWSWLA